MKRDDKERVIGKVVSINSDRFTVELLSGIENFNINGFDDINYFAQLNSYVVVPYQHYYLVAEVSGVRERDMNVPFTNPKEQTLSKMLSGKFLEVLPIGTLKPIEKENDKLEFEFGVSVYPPLYADALYIKQSELDSIFNVHNVSKIICEEGCNDVCEFPSTHKTKSVYKTLSIGKSTIFPDYDIKINIDKFFGGHAAILGNTGSGKSCTIASILQGIYKLKNYSATGSTFVFFDVNGEYKKAFTNVKDESRSIKKSFYNVTSDPKEDESQFFLPHWFLTIEEWALLLQASEKTQLPILRNALGLASVFSSPESVQEIKDHILATCITQILRSDSGSASNRDRITSILQKFGTERINLDTEFVFTDEDGEQNETYSITGIRTTFRYNIRNCITVHFGGMHSAEGVLQFLGSRNEEGVPVFIAENFRMPVYKPYQKFDFEMFDEIVDLAILYEEAHGNKQIRDYCASLITRLKGLKDRSDFEFFRKNTGNIDRYKRMLLGLHKAQGKITKRKQIINIDLSSLEDEIVEVISCVVTRILYEAVKEIEPRNSYPINLILEEAHRYIGNTHNNFLKANQIFERVAKEGRKFGLFLIVSSQRPSELSKTVLSQCNNFIVHRIQNPEDLAHIRQITPHVSETILKRMPSIPTQHALIFGHCVNLPAMFKVNTADPTPDSDNNRISDNWFKKMNHEVGVDNSL